MRVLADFWRHTKLFFSLHTIDFVSEADPGLLAVLQATVQANPKTVDSRIDGEILKTVLVSNGKSSFCGERGQLETNLRHFSRGRQRQVSFRALSCNLSPVFPSISNIRKAVRYMFKLPSLQRHLRPSTCIEEGNVDV